MSAWMPAASRRLFRGSASSGSLNVASVTILIGILSPGVPRWPGYPATLMDSKEERGMANALCREYPATRTPSPRQGGTRRDVRSAALRRITPRNGLKRDDVAAGEFVLVATAR